MRRFAVTLIASIALVTGLRLSPPLSATSERAQGSLRVHTLTDSDATNFLETERTRNPRLVAAEQRAAQRNRRRGYSPTTDVSVVVVSRPYSAAPTSLLGELVALVAPSLNAQSVYEEYFWGAFYAWTDYDDSTWEGSIVAYDEDTERFGTFDTQLVVTDDDPPPAEWAFGEIQGGPEDIPEGEEEPLLLEISSRDIPRTLQFLLQRVSAPMRRVDGSLSLVGGGRTGCDCSLLQGASGEMADCMIANALWDSWPWCAGAAAGCVFTGPGYFGCLGGACLATIIANFIEEMMDVWDRCVMLETGSLTTTQSQHAQQLGG